MGRGRTVVYVSFGLLVVGVLAVIYGWPAVQRYSYIRTAQTDVAAMMKDPGSAQFRNMQTHGKGFTVVCGEVNSRNGYGAYGGFSRFFDTPTSHSAGLEPDASDGEKAHRLFEAEWVAFCNNQEPSFDAGSVPSVLDALKAPQ